MPVPQQPVRTPQVSRRVAASPKRYLHTFHIFFRPPSTTATFATRVLQRCKTCVVMPALNGSTTGWQRGGTYNINIIKNAQESHKTKQDWDTFSDLPVKLKGGSEYQNLKLLSTLFPTPLDTAPLASESPSTMKHEACAVVHVSDGLYEGRSRGGRDTTKRGVSKIDASPWPACSCSTTTGCYPDPRPGGEDRREE